MVKVWIKLLERLFLLYLLFYDLLFLVNHLNAILNYGSGGGQIEAGFYYTGGYKVITLAIFIFWECLAAISISMIFLKKRIGALIFIIIATPLLIGLFGMEFLDFQGVNNISF